MLRTSAAQRTLWCFLHTTCILQPQVDIDTDTRRSLHCKMDAVIGLGKAGTEIVRQLLASGRSVRGVDFEDPATRLEEFGPVPDGLQLQLLQVIHTLGRSISDTLDAWRMPTAEVS